VAVKTLKRIQWRSLKTRVALSTLALFVVSIWAVAFIASELLRQDMQYVLGEQEYSAVSGIAREIDGRLSDRMQALETIAKEIGPKVLANPGALQTLLEQRPLLQLLFNGGAFITRTDGTAIADVPTSAGRIGTNYMDRESVSNPLKNGKTIIGRPIMGKKLGAPIFSIAAPIFDANAKVIGVIVGTINLNKPSFLDQITEYHYGKSGGYLLFALQHNLTVTASDKTRVMQPAPAPGINPMHDRYVKGYEGFGTAVSSRGIMELSAAKRIPSANWLLVATLPVSEAFAPIDRMLGRIFISTLFVSLLAGALTWWLISRMMQQQFGPMLAASREIAIRSNADHPIQKLPISRDDEIGELISGFNILLEKYAQREEALKASEAFKDIVLNSMDAEIAVVDHSGVILSVNDRWVKFALENSPESGKSTPRKDVGTNYLDACRVDVGADEVGVLDAHHGIRAVLEGNSPSFNFEYPCDTPSQQRWFHMTVMPLGRDANAGAVIMHTDITRRKQEEEKIKLAARVFSYAREGIIITDAWGTIVDVNEAFTRITGYSREEVLGKNPRILNSGRQEKTFYESMWNALAAEGHWSGEIWNRRKNGEVFAELLTISAMRDERGKAQQYIALFSDISAIKEHQSQLERIAHFDALTGLPNRVLLSDRLQQAMAQTQRRGQLLAVVYLDLDGFKEINDGHGHDAGDHVLITLAQRMKHMLREGDTLARLGGDEFVAVLIDLENTSASVPLITRMLGAAAQPMQRGAASLQVSASLGVTFYPQEQDIDADQLLRQADQAMYHSKIAGKNRYQIFDSVQDRDLRGHHESLERIRLALSQDEFALYYQPKVNMRSGEVVGAEALIRWQHPERGLLPPSMFLPVIEDHLLAVDVGEWVIDAALTQMEIWKAMGLDQAVSVNIGARQLQRGNFVERLKSIISRHPDIDPARLQLEVLETSALEDIEQVSQVIEECALMGVKFALDDFGTGYSSLTYLKRLRVALLKIDQSFVRDMLDDPNDLAILEGVIGLAAAFKRDVIAEGVETVEHGTLLLQLGCELGQGFGIARPMPPEQIPAWVRTWQPADAWSELPWLGGTANSRFD